MRHILTLALLLPCAAVAQPAYPPCAFPQTTDCANSNRIPAYGVGTGLSGTTAQVAAIIPAGRQIASIAVINRTANAVTGGINVGTTSGGADVASAFAVGANATVVIQGATLLKSIFSVSAAGDAQILWVNAVTSWNSATTDLVFNLVP